VPARDANEELRDYLHSLGVTDDQIAVAAGGGHLAGLAGDAIFGEGLVLTAADLAERAGTDIEHVRAIWRLLGVNVPDGPAFSERDARFTADAVQLGLVDPRGEELLRVIGSAMARVADAAVSLYVQTIEPEYHATDVDTVVWAKELAATAAAAVRLGDSLGAVLVHHLRDAIARQREAQAGTSERAVFRLAVGFVDLVGFTSLSRRLSPAELLTIIRRFEARAFEVATGRNGRIVKHIGDEVMFAALDANGGCAVAVGLMHAFDTEGLEPRGGLVFGDVISRLGDYYGPVVNLAARLADTAIPNELLVDAATAATATDFRFEPAGRRLLKGFDKPVEAYSLTE
jgi:class 3 adenylate cyclase